LLDGPPNRQRPGLVRTWGDGATDRRAHVIEDISFGDTPYVYCRCGETILSGEHTLEQAWDLHRGLTTGYALRFGVPASDDEVDDFLDKIAQPNRKGEPRAPRAPLHHTAPAGDDGSAEQVSLLLDRLRIMGERCTCDTTPVERCPNYVEGDEHDND
jgi:hypothetical protein